MANKPSSFLPRERRIPPYLCLSKDYRLQRFNPTHRVGSEDEDPNSASLEDKKKEKKRLGPERGYRLLVQDNVRPATRETLVRIQRTVLLAFLPDEG